MSKKTATSPDQEKAQPSLAELRAEIQELQRQLAVSQAEKEDLEIALQTTTEHGDFVEAELERSNRKLQREIAQRELAQMTLQSMLEILTRDKADLESILYAVTQHGDTIEYELYSQAAESIRRNEEQFRAIAEATPIAMILTTPSGQIYYANATSGQMLGTDAELLVDSTINNFYASRSDSDRMYQQLSSEGNVRDFEVKLRRCDGEVFWAMASIYPLILQGEAIFLNTFYDITRLKESEAQLREQAQLLETRVQERTKELQQAKEAAEAASRARGEFLANMGHEIRTPLNAIMGFAQIMNLDDQLQDEYKDYLQMIYRSGEHLITLINDILEMSKIEAGKIPIRMVQFNLEEFLHVVRDLVILKAVDKGLSLVIQSAPHLPTHICTDEGKLRQILLNFLSNAIKFTHQGQITIAVEKDSDQHLRFSVIDTGVGIAPEEVNKLFTPFVQTESGRRSGEGTGLGLTISRKYIQLLGGDVTVSSTQGMGTTFSFTIKIDNECKEFAH
jgi:PAS domain S-box-containing protein